MSIVAKRLDGSRWHLAWRWALVQATLCWLGTQLPSPKGDIDPQFSAYFYCRQTPGWIKMALGMEVGLGPGDFVFDGDPATPRTEGTPTTTQFLAHVWMHEDATWYGSRPRPRPYCIRRGPSSARNGHSNPLSFRPVSIVATVVHLSYCWALVFGIYTDGLVNLLNKTNIGCKVGAICTGIFLYADDITSSIQALQSLINLCELELDSLCMSVNAKISLFALWTQVQKCMCQCDGRWSPC